MKEQKAKSTPKKSKSSAFVGQALPKVISVVDQPDKELPDITETQEIEIHEKNIKLKNKKTTTVVNNKIVKKTLSASQASRSEITNTNDTQFSVLHKLDDYAQYEYGVEEITHIRIEGAREHNLKNVSVLIPRNQLVVVTGLSGSGKSSLAFDTLYAEGQRRYVECLSPYARQFLGMMKKPDVDIVEGVSPAISIEQKSVGHNPRSTVGTVTEIYDYLRLLYSKIGVQYCVDCDIPVQSSTIDQIIDSVMNIKEGTRVQILSPYVRGRKGHYREVFELLRKQGYTRVRVDGEVQEIIDGMQLDRYKVHSIELIVDRVMIGADQHQRIAQSIELALNIGDKRLVILTENEDNSWTERLYSTANSCVNCGKSYEELAPNMFSFNSPFGACQKCEGLGSLRDFSRQLLMPEPDLSISDGGIAIIGKERDTWLWKQIRTIAAKYHIDLSIPISEVPESSLNFLLDCSKEKIFLDVPIQDQNDSITYRQEFHGILPTFTHQYTSTTSTKIKSFLEAFMGEVVCPECHGGRLKPESLSVKIDNKNIRTITQLDIPDARMYYSTLSTVLTSREEIIARLILREIISRLTFLENVGLSYLSLNRSARTLSGGESQRIRLASQIGSQLVGVMYVLDEPSIGLHQHDNQKLIESLKDLRDLGNTVIVVEHDREMIDSCDHIIDIGPGAGINGGEVLVSIATKELSSSDVSSSITLQYIQDKREILPSPTIRSGTGQYVTLFGATGNNLQDVDLHIPLGTLTCITGMSGSGKSTLINHTLYPILNKYFFRSENTPLPYKKIEGLEYIDKVIEIDQSPIGRTTRSNPATYTGLFTLIRDHYTLLNESKVRGYKAGRFSFNVVGGRCEECEGGGIKKIEMNFLPDVYIPCDVCKGKRYNDETLQVLFKGKSIADVLSMTVEEALLFFKDIPKIKAKIQALYDVGLTYITLGQQAPTLSGGEAQRVKLATELSKVSTGKTLYLLDEPTTGLHFEDIRILLKLLDKLATKGNTVVVIEHNLDVIKCADWIIDLGPYGGKHGGRIVAQGTRHDIIAEAESVTGKYLKIELERTEKAQRNIERLENFESESAIP